MWSLRTLKNKVLLPGRVKGFGLGLGAVEPELDSRSVGLGKLVQKLELQ